MKSSRVGVDPYRNIVDNEKISANEKEMKCFNNITAYSLNNVDDNSFFVASLFSQQNDPDLRTIDDDGCVDIIFIKNMQLI